MTYHIKFKKVTFDVPPQEVSFKYEENSNRKNINVYFDFFLKILTRDSVTVAVDAVVYFRIFDPVTINSLI